MFNESLTYWTSSKIGLLCSSDKDFFQSSIDKLGALSAEAQALKVSITTMEKLLSDDKQTLIVYSENSQPLGFIKYSYRHLYFFTTKGKSIECDPLCILDFYVSESHQRGGIGKLLLDSVVHNVQQNLNTEVKVNQFAYDRPSPKLIGFMRKNYNLVRPDLQPNKYTIFEGFM